ncbi:MAG: pyrophosphohydrolase [Chitinophagaceae bacterium]|nr:pyrophosphohydrolase [Chitinophagaceae bacterium]
MKSSINLATLVSRIQERLKQPLPGYPAQLGLYSDQGLKDYEKHLQNFEQESDKNPTRQSSVLILLYEKDGQVLIPLIQRPEYEGVHSGQIALPGGKAEPEDQDVRATALRETREEIGVTAEQITVLGTLTSVYIPPSRFWVNVVLGYSESVPVFIPDQREVASVIEFPLDHLADPKHIEEREVIRAQQWKMNAPGYAYQGHFIWGATAMILTELRELLKN